MFVIAEIASGLARVAPNILEVVGNRGVADRDLVQARNKLQQADKFLVDAKQKGAGEVLYKPLADALERLLQTHNDALHGKICHEQNMQDATNKRVPQFILEFNAIKWSAGRFNNLLDQYQKEVNDEIQILCRYLTMAAPEVQPEAAEPDPPSVATPRMPTFEPGEVAPETPHKYEVFSYVVIHGVENKPDLNSQVALVLMYKGGEDKRYRVVTSDGEHYELRESCLTSALDLQFVEASRQTSRPADEAAPSGDRTEGLTSKQFVYDHGTLDAAVNSNLIREPGPMDMIALSTPPIELTSKVPEDWQEGTPVKICGPHGPIEVFPPAGTKLGERIIYRITPMHEFRIEVPPDAKPGLLVNVRRADGVEVCVLVPPHLRPGDTFEVLPPALMVLVPEGVKPGDRVAFTHTQNPHAAPDQQIVQWLRAKVPEAVKPGMYFAARLPDPESVRKAEERRAKVEQLCT